MMVVVGLSGKLNWFERLPFFGRTIVVTRMKEKSGALRDKLEERGASVLEFPVVEILPLTSFSQLDKVILTATRFDWLVFTSSFGVDAFF
jgi:uroporphyrinogen III methyltransferase/synthase